MSSECMPSSASSESSQSYTTTCATKAGSIVGRPPPKKPACRGGIHDRLVSGGCSSTRNVTPLSQPARIEMTWQYSDESSAQRCKPSLANRLTRHHTSPTSGPEPSTTTYSHPEPIGAPRRQPYHCASSSPKSVCAEHEPRSSSRSPPGHTNPVSLCPHHSCAPTPMEDAIAHVEWLPHCGLPPCRRAFPQPRSPSDRNWREPR